ncbi:DedA family protein [Fodinicola feengrottensis]|uniref:DedA family protein n=1 Tax=Fodinicola feengrottensis TaxID=435914 RepID=A0ABP4V556_9ACTN
MHWVAEHLASVPPIVVFLLVALVIGVESMGVPLPGEVVLLAAALLATTGHVSPWGVAIGAAAGAIVGDSIGYYIGRRGGRALLEKLGRKFPKHMGPPQLAQAERVFTKWGAWAVFFGRFVALLRIFAGPLAGSMKMPYPRFLIANAAGGICWAFGTTFLIFSLGQVAEQWLSRFSWAALAIALLAGVVSTMYLRHRAAKLHAASPVDDASVTHEPSHSE